MVLLDLLTSAISAVLYGVIAAAALMTVLFVVLKTINNGTVKSIQFYATGVVLALLLTIQFSLMIGAVQAQDTLESVEITINQLMENASGTFSANDSQQLLDYIRDEYPIIGTYIGVCDFSGATPETIGTAMTQAMRDYLSSYIWHRVFWITGFSIVACAIAILFRKKDSQYAIDPDADLGIY